MTVESPYGESIMDLPALLLHEVFCVGPWRRVAPIGHVYIHVWNNIDDEGAEGEDFIEVDTFAVIDESKALVERTNVTGNPIWRYEGTVTEVIAALRDLKAPGKPGAPTIELRKGTPDDRPL
jgi:hypothetical protein